MKTLLVALSHPDDEVGCAGTIAVHVAAGHRVVMLFLTRGEMTEALGVSDAEHVAQQRMQHARAAADIAGAADVRFLEFADTRVEVSAAASYRVAQEIAQVKPDAVITWGDAWVRGPRHPDHQATGQIVRNAITLARIARVVKPHEPHRGAAPVFAIRDIHSTLPEVVIDVSAHVERVHALADHYRARVGWPDRAWLQQRLEDAGRRHGVAAAELLDSYETAGGQASSLMDLRPIVG
ncbi:MAG TPA: PIG-L family deacetylase [Longimicrobiales bacterium]|nr:PIG-L family deacetylase [Longimicrobiales bacterium]